MKAPVLSLLLCLAGAPALAHGTDVHKTNAETTQHQQQPAPALPFDLKLGGPFQLTDQTGKIRTQVNPDGHMQLLFFGYANCASICTAALPLMGDVVDDLAGRGLNVTPVMITVDPKRDTVETIGPALQKHHPDFVGLTGSAMDLQVVYDLFAIAHDIVFTDPALGDVFSHGSHIYLLDPQGKFLTLLPPILSAGRMVDIVQNYADTGV